MDVFEGITALADYGVRTGLIEEADRTWALWCTGICLTPS